jgi:hypothetical protein
MAQLSESHPEDSPLDVLCTFSLGCFFFIFCARF